MRGLYLLLALILLLLVVGVPLRVEAKTAPEKEKAQSSPSQSSPLQEFKERVQKRKQKGVQMLRLVLDPTGNEGGGEKKANANRKKRDRKVKQSSPSIIEGPERDTPKTIPRQPGGSQGGLKRHITGFFGRILNPFSGGAPQAYLPSEPSEAPPQCENKRRVLAASQYFKERNPTPEELRLVDLVEQATNIIESVSTRKLDLITEEAVIEVMSVIGDIDAIMRQMESLPLVALATEEFQRAISLLEFVSSLAISLQRVPDGPQLKKIMLGLSRILIEGLGALSMAILDVERVAIHAADQVARMEAEQAAMAEAQRQQELIERERSEQRERAALETAGTESQHTLREWTDQALKATFALNESLDPIQTYFTTSHAISGPVKEKATNVIEGTRAFLLKFVNLITENSMDD